MFLGGHTGGVTCVLGRRAGMEIFLVGFCIQSTVHTIEKLSNRAHCEEYKVTVSAIFRNSRKWQSINEEFNATGREMKFCKIVTVARWLAEYKMILQSILTIRE